MARTSSELRDIVDAHTELLGDDANTLLDQYIATARKAMTEAHVRTLEERRRLLVRCRELGVEKAFLEFEMHSLVPEIAKLSTEDDVLQRIELLEQALTRLDSERRQSPRHKYLSALLRGRLGADYLDHETGGGPANVELAITCLEDALEVLTPETSLIEWIQAQRHLGLAYIRRDSSRHDDDLEHAITAFKAALHASTGSELRVEWATLHQDLGVVHIERVHGTRADNVEDAISHLNRSCEVFTREAFPADWAATQYNLGSAYRHRVRGVRTENLMRAIACYNSALKVRTRQAQPVEWAMTQNGLGLAYTETPEGNRADNLEKAITCYIGARDVFARHTRLIRAVRKVVPAGHDTF